MHNQYLPTGVMAQDELMTMYPRIYYQIQPIIARRCDVMHMQRGIYYTPTHEEVGMMVDDVLSIAKDIDQDELESRDSATRQVAPLLNTLIGVLLIQELLERRRRLFTFNPFFRGQHY